MFYYLNDFFVIFVFKIDIELYNCQFDALCNQLNFNINYIKNIFGNIVDFLKIELDSYFMQTKFFSNKLARAKHTMKFFFNKIIISYRELEIVISFLLFTIKIVIFKKTFLRRLFNVFVRSITIIRIITLIKIDFL